MRVTGVILSSPCLLLELIFPLPNDTLVAIGTDSSKAEFQLPQIFLASIASVCQSTLGIISVQDSSPDIDELTLRKQCQVSKSSK